MNYQDFILQRGLIKTTKLIIFAFLKKQIPWKYTLKT